VFVWIFFDFPVGKASKLKQTGSFGWWLSKSQSTLQAKIRKHILRCFEVLPAAFILTAESFSQLAHVVSDYLRCVPLSSSFLV
jgi:hypothetical protein